VGFDSVKDSVRHSLFVFDYIFLLADDEWQTTNQPGNVGGLFFRENSSNGGEYRQNFLAKSYEPKKRGVKGFFPNK